MEICVKWTQIVVQTIFVVAAFVWNLDTKAIVPVLVVAAVAVAAQRGVIAPVPIHAMTGIIVNSPMPVRAHANQFPIVPRVAQIAIQPPGQRTAPDINHVFMPHVIAQHAAKEHNTVAQRVIMAPPAPEPAVVPNVRHLAHHAKRVPRAAHLQHHVIYRPVYLSAMPQANINLQRIVFTQINKNPTMVGFLIAPPCPATTVIWTAQFFIY